MGKVVVRNQPCLSETCGSSDARQIYEEGTSFCFSCSTWFPKQEKEEKVTRYMSSGFTAIEDLDEIAEYPTKGFRDRNIHKKVTEYFNVKVTIGTDGEPDAHYYPYGTTEIVGYKKRVLPKEFTFIGKLKGLFGQMQAGDGGKSLVITEGEIDAMTIAQAWSEKYNKIFPVVSLPSASGTKNLLENREWVRRFDTVILWLDDDDAGRIALESCAKIIGYDKVKVIKNTKFKDANEMYLAEGYQTVLNTLWNAQNWSPAGVINSGDTWELFEEEEDRAYIPWPPFAKELNDKIYGRTLGSITILCSGTGMGKSSFIKEDQYHLLCTQPTEDKIGICSLEESVGETIKGIVSLHLNKRLQLPDVECSVEEKKQAWEETMGGRRVEFINHQGSVDDNSLIDKMEYMALVGCKFLYLDHITIAVSESDGDVNSATDKMMSDLLKLAKRHNVWIGVVSHLRKTNNNQKSFEEGAVPSDDDLKGSGSLKQIAAQIIAISRNKKEVDPVKRHTSAVWALKDRWTGRTGPMGKYQYMEDTGRLKYQDMEEGFEML
jgi:twinkle protein